MSEYKGKQKSCFKVKSLLKLNTFDLLDIFVGVDNPY